MYEDGVWGNPVVGTSEEDCACLCDAWNIMTVLGISRSHKSWCVCVYYEFYKIVRVHGISSKTKIAVQCWPCCYMLETWTLYQWSVRAWHWRLKLNITALCDDCAVSMLGLMNMIFHLMSSGLTSSIPTANGNNTSFKLTLDNYVINCRPL